jgi:hypothetical protein
MEGSSTDSNEGSAGLQGDCHRRIVSLSSAEVRGQMP